tara:strand:- start:1441 stop:1848 length:408 start_codon:yes stop_codon:yes gene_type:complete
MSNDTTYKLTFTHKSKIYLNKVLDYLDDKEFHFKEVCKEMNEAGDWSKFWRENPDRAKISTWGFTYGRIKKVNKRKQYFVRLTTYANENINNIAVSGEEGELVFLLEKFPTLKISGSFNDDYGAGKIDGYFKVYV